MASWNDVSTPVAASQSGGGGWDAVSKPVAAAIPDMTGVHTMAMQNLQAQPENETAPNPDAPPPTFGQQMDKGAGFPVSATLNSQKAQPELPEDVRGHMMNAYKNGTATDAPDFMHSFIHTIARAVVPITAAAVKEFQDPMQFAKESLQAIPKGVEAGVKNLENFATMAKMPTPVLDDLKAKLTTGQPVNWKDYLGTFNEGFTNSPPGQAMSSVFNAVGGVAQPTFDRATKILEAGGIPKEVSQLIMNLSPLAHFADGNGHPAASTEFPKGTGPFAEPPTEFKQLIGEKVGKPAAQVTDNDIASAIRMGYEDKGIPKAKDFQDTAIVMSTEGNVEPAAQALRDTYKEANVPPDRVHADAQTDPSIAGDIREGKVPDIYKKPTPEEQMAELEKGLNQEGATAEQRAAIEKQMDKLADKAGTKKPVEPAITAEIDAKVENMRDEFAAQRLASLNKKLVNGMALSIREGYEREALSEKVSAVEKPQEAPPVPLEETEAAKSGGRDGQEELTPEHKEIEDKLGVPETMSKNMLTRISTNLEKIFADKQQVANLNDEQYQALEDYTRRVEAAQEKVNQSTTTPGGMIANFIKDEAGSVNLPSIPDSAKEFADDIKRDVLNFTTPMETGSDRARASAKDFANRQRWAQWNGARIINLLTDRFTPPELEGMWKAMDEASVHAQTLEANGMGRAQAMLETEKAGIGHFALPDEQKAIITELSKWAEHAWDEAKRLEMVDGAGLPFWTPRMAAVIGEDGSWHSPSGKGERPTLDVGKNLRTSSANLKNRKYLTAAETETAMKEALGDETKNGTDVQLVKDIRTMPMALTRLEQAIGGRSLVDEIKEMGKATGAATVQNSKGEGYFTIDHPAFTRYQPRLFMGIDGKWNPVNDPAGDPIFDKVPLYISKEFEGPLKAVLSQDSSAVYKALMDIKSKSMGMIMYSPIIHNAVEWGRALPAMPGKVATFRIYFEGNRLKNDPVQMKEAIDAGLVPIGSRFFNQDINSIIEQPNLTPGRSWTAKLLGGLVGKVNEGAGNAVKTAIDNAGDFWHNTLLWDRVGDLQAGLYGNIRDQAMKNGMDPQAAQAVAAHIANRFAGALPMESMSNAARKMANITMFSRSFTIGNLGVMKDMLAGMPSDVYSQLARDVGETQADKASKAVRNKAIAAFVLDVGLMYVGNSILQDTLDKLMRDKTMDQIAHGYVDRWNKLMTRHAESPWELLNLPKDLEELSSTATNEPGKQNRILWSKDPKTGTAYYMRIPTGKIGEEFQGWLTSPLDMARRKMSPLVSPLVDIYKNEDYFGHPIYDKDARGISGAAESASKAVGHLFQAQIPGESIKSAYHLLTGTSQDKSLEEMKTFGPLAGLTFSKGYPGGPEAGILAASSRRHEAEISGALPQIKEAVEGGDVKKAQEIMDNLGITPRERTLLIRHYEHPENKVNPRTMRKFEQTATPEEKELMEEQIEPNKQ